VASLIEVGEGLYNDHWQAREIDSLDGFGATRVNWRSSKRSSRRSGLYSSGSKGFSSSSFGMGGASFFEGGEGGPQGRKLDRLLDSSRGRQCGTSSSSSLPCFLLRGN
jgi:hypothetical protein